MIEPVTQQAKRLGYQASYTKRGVRLRKAGGRFVLFRNDAATRAYLNAVERALKKQDRPEAAT